MDRDKCIRNVVFAGKKLSQFEFFQFVNQQIMFSRDFFLGVRAVRRVVFFGSQLLQRAQIFDLAFQLLERINQRAQS